MNYKYYILFIALCFFQHVHAEVNCIFYKNNEELYKLPHTFNCLKDQTVYECETDFDPNYDNRKFFNDGCYRVSARCKVVWSNIHKTPEDMLNFREGNISSDINQAICLKKLWCLSSGLDQTAFIKPKDYIKTVAQFKVFTEIAKECEENINNQDKNIFVGKPMECSKNIANFKNCCGISGSGWEEGVFAFCDAEEKELARKRDAGLAVSVGDYCYNKVLGKCISEHYVYCVFPSKIARIIQEQGRKNQLGVNFGIVYEDGVFSNCRGITLEELSKIDFDLIDYNELVGDLTSSQPVSSWQEEDCHAL